jgi:hypothetical protein
MSCGIAGNAQELATKDLVLLLRFCVDVLSV